MDDELAGLPLIHGPHALGIDDLPEHERRQELERVDVEEHDEEKDRVQDDHRPVGEAEAAEELTVQVPDPDERGERDRERDEVAERMDQVVVGARDLERDDEQGEGEREDRVGERLQACGSRSAVRWPLRRAC
jgi:hypothetical protein